MDKNVRKAFLIGIGLSLLTKEKVEKEVKKYFKDHHISDAEAKRIASKILKQGKEHTKKLDSAISEIETHIKRHAKHSKHIIKKVAKKRSTKKKSKKKTARKKTTKKKATRRKSKSRRR